MTTKTIEKSLLVIEMLAASQGPRGVGDLSRELAMPKSNVFRLLDTLVRHRYVHRRVEDSRYELTLKLWELGTQVLSRTSLTRVAAPFLDQLAVETRESVHLAVFDAGESVFIDKKDGPRPIGGVTRIGSRAPAHCVATGKVQLAFQPQAQVGVIGARRARFTASTITSRAALEREMAQIRAQGYAVNRGEWFEDVWGVAAAIRNQSGAVCASVGIWGPRQRLFRSTGKLAKAVIAAAQGISESLGFSRADSIATDRRRVPT